MESVYNLIFNSMTNKWIFFIQTVIAGTVS